MQKTIYGKLKCYDEKIYQITHPMEFNPLGSICNEDVTKCLDFSYEMAFGEGKHRDHRSGGERKRRSGEIFTNAFQGKLAEYGMYQYLKNNHIESDEPDLAVEGLGKWDSFDLRCYEQLIAVKSTKFYGQLLLLETADWNIQGKYLPNIGKEGETYDSIILLRIRPSCEDIMKSERLLFSEKIEKAQLVNLLEKQTWEYDIAGFITNADLRRLIQKEYILPKGAVLNKKTIMDAENYYVQAGDMRRSRDFIKRMRVHAEKLNDLSRIAARRNL